MIGCRLLSVVCCYFSLLLFVVWCLWRFCVRPLLLWHVVDLCCCVMLVVLCCGLFFVVRSLQFVVKSMMVWVGLLLLSCVVC